MLELRMAIKCDTKNQIRNDYLNKQWYPINFNQESRLPSENRKSFHDNVINMRSRENTWLLQLSKTL